MQAPHRYPEIRDEAHMSGRQENAHPYLSRHGGSALLATAGFLLLRAASLRESWSFMVVAVGLILLGMIRQSGHRAFMKRH